jgi:hypothetical protein
VEPGHAPEDDVAEVQVDGALEAGFAERGIAVEPGQIEAGGTLEADVLEVGRALEAGSGEVGLSKQGPTLVGSRCPGEQLGQQFGVKRHPGGEVQRAALAQLLQGGGPLVRAGVGKTAPALADLELDAFAVLDRAARPGRPQTGVAYGHGWSLERAKEGV